MTDQGVAWQSLGIFTMTSNVLHVSTWNSPTDGAICVDGVRIVPVSTSASQRRTGEQCRHGDCYPGDLRAGNRCAVARCFDAVGKRRMVHRSDGGGGRAVRTVREPVPVLVQQKWGCTPLYPGQFNAINPLAVDKIDLPSVVDHETGLLGLGRSGRIPGPLDERPVGHWSSPIVVTGHPCEGLLAIANRR